MALYPFQWSVQEVNIFSVPQCVTHPIDVYLRSFTSSVCYPTYGVIYTARETLQDPLS